MPINLNKWTVAGNLVRAVEVKEFEDRKVGKFTIAVNRTYKAGDEKKTEVEYIDCELWGTTRVDALAQYTDKGASLYVEGRAQIKIWEKEDGTKGKAIVCVVDDFQFNDSKGKAE